MFSKLVRLGKSAEMSTTPNGKQVCKIVAAYDVGWGDSKRTVWVDASWWGDRGAKVAQYLTKGVQCVIHADDVEPDAYQSAKGISTKLKMNITNIELVSGQLGNLAPGENRQDKQFSQPKQYTQPSPSAAIPNANDFDDDIPF